MTAREVLDGIKDRLAAATPGPWEFDGAEITTVPDYESDNPTPWKAVMDCEVSCGSYCYGGSVAMNIGEDDRAFIAAAPVDVARLTRAVEAVLEIANYWERTPALRKGTAASKVRAAIENALGEGQ